MEENNKTQFNAGIAKLIRIDRLRSRIHLAREIKDYTGWASSLSGWREEMHEKMDKEEEKRCETHESNINEALNGRNEFVKMNYLKKYGLYLSGLDYKYGYGMPDREEDEGL